MKKYSYPTSTQLDSVVFEMYKAGMVFSEAVREFRKEFVLTALRTPIGTKRMLQANWECTETPLPARFES